MRATTAAIVGMLLLSACSDAGTPVAPTSAPVDPGASMTIATAEGEWTIPYTVCDPQEAAAAASVTSGGVEGLVAARASGWPTTSAPPPGGDERFEQASAHAGILTLALAGIAGTEQIVLDRWAAFEGRYANEALGYPPVTEIATRLDGWQRAAVGVRAAIEAECALSG